MDGWMDGSPKQNWREHNGEKKAAPLAVLFLWGRGILHMINNNNNNSVVPMIISIFISFSSWSGYYQQRRKERRKEGRKEGRRERWKEESKKAVVYLGLAEPGTSK